MRKFIFLLTCALAMMFCMTMGECEAAEIASKPQVGLDSYYLNNEKVVLGEDNSIHLEFCNQSRYPVSDIMISFSSENNTVVPTYGESNQLYISKIGAKETVGVDFPINIVNHVNGYATMSFSIEYCVGTQVLSNNMSYIVIPIDTVEKISIKNLNVSSTAQVNSKVSVVVNYENIGKNTLQDVHLIINSEDFEKPIDLLAKDMLAAGEVGYFEYYLSFDTIGNKKVSFETRYLDEKGNEYSMDCGEYVVQVTKQDDVLNDESEADELQQGISQEKDNNEGAEEAIGSSRLIVGIVCIAVIMCVLVGVFVWRKRLK